jgi:CheY-like chemotaxis protein
MTYSISDDAVQILLVEDNPLHVKYTEKVVREISVPCQLHVVGDGAAALRFLRHESPFDLSPCVELVLLDLYLPRVDGLDVLAAMRDDPDLQEIPVIVLTAEEAAEELLAERGLSAVMCLTKSEQISDLVDKLDAYQGFKVAVAQVPRPEEE